MSVFPDSFFPPEKMWGACKCYVFNWSICVKIYFHMASMRIVIIYNEHIHIKYGKTYTKYTY